MATMAGMASVSFTQAGRPFTVTTPLGADKLLLERFTGEEAVSAPFHFTLDMVSKSNNVSADSLAEARRRIDGAGLSNVEFRQADIFDLPFEAFKLTLAHRVPPTAPDHPRL